MHASVLMADERLVAARILLPSCITSLMPGLSEILQPAQLLSEMFKKSHCTAVINVNSDED